MPSASGAIVYNVPGAEKTIIAGKSSGAYGHMLQLNYDDTYLRILRYYGGNWKSTDWEKISAGYADSAGSVAWGNVSSKPSTATRWPTWDEVTDKITSKTIYGNTYIDSNGNFQNVSGWVGATETTDFSFPGLGANKGIRVVSNAGSQGTASPSGYMVGINISAYYGLSIATYGGGDSTTLWWRNNGNSWREVIHSGNYTTYCATASHTHAYLPLSGGTLTGDAGWTTDNHKLYFYNNAAIGKPTGHGLTLYGDNNSTIVYISDGTNYYDVYHKGNLGVFVKSGSTAASGLVPKPDTTAGTTKFLCEDGTWKTPTYTSDTNTWREIKVNGTQKRSTAITSGDLDFINGSNTTVEWTSDNKLKINSTWTAWKGATDSANGTAGYMPAPTSAQRGQFLRGDGSWVSLNNYSLPTASNSKLGGVKTGAAITDTTGYTAVAIKDGVIYYKDNNTTYKFSNL
jgi:hypothetical protein